MKAIQTIHPRELPRRIQPARVQFVFERERYRRHQSGVRYFFITLGNRDREPFRIKRHRAAAIADISNHFHADPGATVTSH